MKRMNELVIDQLEVKIYDSRQAMGEVAARDVEGKMQQLLKEKEVINMIFASAPSQNEFLEALSCSEGIDWGRVNAFHMDEYIGLPLDHPQRFANFLKERLFDRLNFRNIYLLHPDTENPERSCDEYAQLLQKLPPDIVCMGIGENNHIAFNDPHVADFHDKKLAKVIRLDEVSRYQQVHDGCFPTLAAVPQLAVTLTIPALIRAGHICCVVPGVNKAEAVCRTLREPVSEKYPSTILRSHPDAVMYLDNASAANLDL